MFAPSSESQGGTAFCYEIIATGNDSRTVILSVLESLRRMSSEYVWSHDVFPPTSVDAEKLIHGNVLRGKVQNAGEGVLDEWYVVFLFLTLSATTDTVRMKIWDEDDGEFLLIEDDTDDEDNSFNIRLDTDLRVFRNKVWIVRGQVEAVDPSDPKTNYIQWKEVTTHAWRRAKEAAHQTWHVAHAWDRNLTQNL
eukprot:PhF_6_TR5082/c0_g1_i1/m.7129